MQKKLFVNGTFYAFDFLLNTHDLIEIDWKGLHPDFPLTMKKEVKCVYEDDDIAIFDKPSGLLVHEDGKNFDTLTNRVSAYFQSKGYPYPVLPVHRIDSDTSGMVIFGKHPLAMSYLSYLFESQLIEKMYVCLVHGRLEQETGEIEKQIGGDRHSNKQVISSQGKTAKTSFEVVDYEEESTRLHVYIHGGRKHQIRVHLESIGFPILGDMLYGRKAANRLMLHFKKVSFKHPRNLELFTFTNLEPF
ncbi:MAG: RluA family pseudouridine synthase [Acholeplasmataceae bacterium]|nr:RluA family pseudouridine synthase [Acholeplasmataceae bacterium]